MNAYAVIGDGVRTRVRAQQDSRDLLAAVRLVNRSCETLDLETVIIAHNLQDDKYGEAQLRCDAAERAAEELLATVQALAVRIRHARLSRSTAA